MATLQISLILGLFVLMALLMFFRVMPALIALPLMALQTSLIGGVSPADVGEYVVGQGVLKLHVAYTVTMFGCMLSMVLHRTGVAESFVKKGAELSGDKPWSIAVLMLVLVTTLFTTLAGLGAIIMVATIVLPILSSAGIGPTTVVGIFLFGLSIGGTLNVANWAVYTNVMQLPVETVRPFAIVMFLITFTAALVYVTARLHADGHDVRPGAVVARSLLFLLLVAGSIALYRSLPAATHDLLAGLAGTAARLARWAVAAGLAALLFAAAGRAATGRGPTGPDVHASAYVTPVVPLVLIMLFGVHFVTAFVAGIVYAFATTYRKGRLNLFIQAIFEGGAAAMPAVVLMFGIGMLLIAIMGPGSRVDAYPDGWPVAKLLESPMRQIVPGGPLSYVATFSLIAPLALYRGPLNVWGMGYGLAAIFLACGLTPAAVMGLLMSVGQIQGISDPTNTHNVWLANEMRVDVQKVLYNTLPYTWVVAIVGLVASAAMFVR